MRTVEITPCSLNKLNLLWITSKIKLEKIIDWIISWKIWALTVIFLLLWEDQIPNGIDTNEQTPPPSLLPSVPIQKKKKKLE